MARALPIACGLLTLACALGAQAPESGPDFDPAELETSVHQIAEVFSLLEQRLADPFDVNQAFYAGAIPAMVRTLDPHSAFLDPQQFESLQQMQRSTEKGFGSVVSISLGRVTVLQTLPESPSMRAGLSPGDEIVAINGYVLSQLSVEQLVGLLSQSRQQPAQLMVQRPNFARLIPLTLVPEEMADPSVRNPFHLEDGIGYVKLGSFGGATDVELHEAIESLGGRDLKGLVIDLRKNPGGVVEAAIGVAALFLEPNQRILWIQGRNGPQEEVRAPADNEPYRFPVAVVVNEETASASEIVSGALQDHDRAAIVGTRTYGKGLVQRVYPLSEDSGLALTTALYLSPSERPIQRPMGDCQEFQLASCEQQEAGEYATDSGRMIPGGGGVQPDVVVAPRSYSRFEIAIAASNSYLDFARKIVEERKEAVGPDFQVTPAILDDFQLFLSKRSIRPTLSEWTATVELIRAGLQQEVLNLAVGVDAGERIELRVDPQIKAALAQIRAKR
ncbi:MAG: S41 family peptidase [Acidobacteria bacterium]|nr:S41 family peptidase [Acidobacteriota bacterium]